MATTITLIPGHLVGPDDALQASLAQPSERTRDVGGEASTSEFADALVRRIERG